MNYCEQSPLQYEILDCYDFKRKIHFCLRIHNANRQCIPGVLPFLCLICSLHVVPSSLIIDACAIYKIFLGSIMEAFSIQYISAVHNTQLAHDVYCAIALIAYFPFIDVVLWFCDVTCNNNVEYWHYIRAHRKYYCGSLRLPSFIVICSRVWCCINMKA